MTEVMDWSVDRLMWLPVSAEIGGVGESSVSLQNIVSGIAGKFWSDV